MSGSGGSSTQLFDISATVPAMLDCLTIQNPSRFCTGSVSETSSGSLTTQESDIYQMGSVGTAPSSQKLLQENQQEQQQQVQPLPLPATPPQPPPTTQSLQQQPQSLNHTLMVSLPLGSEQFAHFTANQAIFEAFETEERVHVIDLDILQGYQWPAFMQALAARPGGAPFLRITGVGSSMENVKETGRCLTELAHFLHVPLEYHPVAEELVDLKPHMFNRRVGEVLAVNSANRLHRVPGNCLGNLLAMIRDQAPNIVTALTCIVCLLEDAKESLWSKKGTGGMMNDVYPDLDSRISFPSLDWTHAQLLETDGEMRTNPLHSRADFMWKALLLNYGCEAINFVF
ncbi:hypothetical protein OIU84_025007 [Salix udensis]|uniref:Uncharacterized protein n=1 Tax=Salix udensis TaxID=889485 RepID=A0AAD6KJX3_9ROSI|nr:hypothetical protein OIU84_025007 [Salix udensis]